MPLMCRAGPAARGAIWRGAWARSRGAHRGTRKRLSRPLWAASARWRRWSPTTWETLYAQLRRTALAIRDGLSGLPRGVVHGDAWPGNAVQSGPDTVILIDWGTSGLGLPVLDLGNCLIESLLDARPLGAGPAGWLVEPDEDRIAAVAGGYAEQRMLGEAERALLPEAVCFGACYAGAIHLHQALAEGVCGASMEARLERLRNRVAVSEAVARLAAPHLAGGAETVR